ncbi:hypothetical protein [Arthrobacter sp. HLT1-20]
MTISSEIRRLAWRTKYLFLTVLVYGFCFTVLALQFGPMLGNDAFTTFANWALPIVMFGDLGFMYFMARRNVNQFRLHILNSPAPGA